MNPLYLIEWKNRPVIEQLAIEEALLRADERSFVIINAGSLPAIVLGISNPLHQCCNISALKEQSIPSIRRYSGGGTVIVDENTLFISFIFSKKDLSIETFPEPIMRWCYEFYQNAWNLPGFSLKENDFTIKDLKCGGNAQYICKNRWCHHTSFLWDYDPQRMACIHLPQKQPLYRLQRSHEDFLYRLKDKAHSMQQLIDSVKEELVKRFYICKISEEEILSIQKKQHRKTTQWVE